MADSCLTPDSPELAVTGCRSADLSHADFADIARRCNRRFLKLFRKCHPLIVPEKSMPAGLHCCQQLAKAYGVTSALPRQAAPT